MSSNIEFNNFLHDCRSICLQKIPQADKILSIGCAGKWYFEWFHKFYPHSFELHTGIDLNSPPEDLPDKITWIQHDCSDLDLITSESFDLVFAGQFIEHIPWDAQVVFLAEVHRVLKPNGIFVLDSPNYHVTNRYGWRQPEHIHELTSEQASQLLELSSFKIQNSYGLVPVNFLGTPPKLVGKCLESYFEASFYQEDIIDAVSIDTDNCMVWWITAIKKNHAIPKRKLRAKSYDFFRKNQQEKISIVLHQIGKIIKEKNKYFILLNSSDEQGYALFGPYEFYPEGYYSIEFDIQILDNELVKDKMSFPKKIENFIPENFKSYLHKGKSIKNNLYEGIDKNFLVASVDVSTDGGNLVIAKKEVLLNDLLINSKISLTFYLDRLYALEFRVLYFPSIPLKINVQPQVSVIQKKP